jgi:hypothetical protein
MSTIRSIMFPRTCYYVLLCLFLIGCGGGGAPAPAPTPTPDPNAFTGYTGRLLDESDAAVQGVFIFEGQRYTTNAKGEFSVPITGSSTGGNARIEAGTTYFTRVDNAKLPADSVGQRCVPQGNTTLTNVTFRLNIPVATGESVALGTFRLYTKVGGVPPPCLNN